MSIFNPKSIAIVGVSQEEKKIGSSVLMNLKKGGYKGELYPVNPKHSKLHGFVAYPKVSDIPESVELVIVAVPAAVVMDVIKDCAEVAVKYVMVLSAGFGETGAKGMSEELALAEYCKAHNMRLIGPNCLGIIVPGLKLNASFASHMPQDGNIAFLSQSGAFNTAILDMALEEGLGFSHFVSMGNKADINEIDFLKDWLSDQRVKVIGIYIEEFSDGRELLKLAIKHRKPIIILHPGESKEARQAMSSHTGSLANSANVVEASLREANIVQVYSIEEMFNTLKLFAWATSEAGENVAVVTNAGGPGIIATDMIITSGLKLSKLSDITESRLREFLPEASGFNNPVDLLGDADAERYKKALNILMLDPKVDTILLILTPQYVTEIVETAIAIQEEQKTGQKQIVSVFLGGQDVRVGREHLQRQKLPVFDFLEEAIRSLKSYTDYQTRFIDISMDLMGYLDSKGSQINLEEYVTNETKPLPYEIVQKLLDEVNINRPAEKIVYTAQEVLEFAAELGYPLVLKATTEEIIHKTDFKALYLNIRSDEELVNKFRELQMHIDRLNNHSKPKLLIQSQVSGDQELIVGVKRDGNKDVYNKPSGFGHILLFGTGGIYTEVYKDVSVGLLPLNKKGLNSLISNTKVSTIIKGTRGKTSLAIDRLLQLLLAVQRLVIMHPEIESIDFNPVMLTEEDYLVVDAKVFVKA